jgi:hypothetical protein
MMLNANSHENPMALRRGIAVALKTISLMIVFLFRIAAGAFVFSSSRRAHDNGAPLLNYVEKLKTQYRISCYL